MPEIPSLDILIAKYPNGNPEDVAKVVGGTVEEYFTKYSEFRDTCAVRVSHALNLGGDPIPWAGGNLDNIYIKGIKVRTYKGANGKFYFFSTIDMRVYLNTRYKRAKEITPKAEAEKKLKGRKGIIAFGWFHIDLWDGEKCTRKCYFDHEKVDSIFFWESR